MDIWNSLGAAVLIDFFNIMPVNEMGGIANELEIVRGRREIGTPIGIRGKIVMRTYKQIYKKGYPLLPKQDSE